jgi:hypothetical protein
MPTEAFDLTNEKADSTHVPRKCFVKISRIELLDDFRSSRLPPQISLAVMMSKNKLVTRSDPIPIDNLVPGDSKRIDFGVTFQYLHNVKVRVLE